MRAENITTGIATILALIFLAVSIYGLSHNWHGKTDQASVFDNHIGHSAGPR